MKVMRTGAALAAMMLVAGCASIGADMQAPRLSLVGASMLSADVFSQQFRVRIRAENPNDIALPVKSLDYTLFIEGQNFAEGMSEAAFVVPAKGEKEFDLTVRTNFASSIARLVSNLSMDNRNTIQYVFAGTVVADMPFSPKFKFNEAGSVDLARK
jgi:LEA14-like dessication related protein